MFYRVDYVLALVLAGALTSIVLSRRAAAIAAHRLARGFLIATGTRVALAVAVFVAQQAIGLAVPPIIAALLNDLGHVMLGLLYGLAAVHLVRGGFAGVLRAPELWLALCLSAGVTFVLAGTAKAFYLDTMLTFFTQSGYSRTFLYFILTVEILGGLAMVLPWRWLVLAAVAGLALDMAGAIYTHVHNGDPLDDSTGAIGALLRLAPIAVLGLGRLWTVAGAAACGALAIAGSALVRQPPAPAGDGLDYFVGSWQCAGTFARTGKPIEADVRAERGVDGRWLIMHHDDHPPNPYHALAEWSAAATGWIASLQDNAGAVRSFRSTGWQGHTLIWEGGDPGKQDQRFIYERLDDAQLEVRFELRAATGWRPVDTLRCHR